MNNIKIGKKKCCHETRKTLPAPPILESVTGLEQTSLEELADAYGLEGPLHIPESWLENRVIAENLPTPNNS